MFKTSIIYRTNVVENKDPHRLASKQYYLVYIDDNGTKIPALLTDADISKAVIRAIKNKEDAPEYKLNFWQKFLSLFGL